QQEVIEVAVRPEDREEIGAGPPAVRSGRLLDKLPQRVELAWREASCTEAFEQIAGAGHPAGEETIEILPVAREVRAALDDHRADGVAERLPVLEADQGRDGGDVDGLRGGDDEAVTAQRPQELVQDVEHRPAIRAGARRGA